MKNQTPSDRASGSKGKEAHVDSAATTPNGGNSVRASGGRRRGRRNGAHQPSSKLAALATMDASRQVRRPNINSFPMSSTSSGSSATRSMLPEVCQFLYVLTAFIGIIFLVINSRSNEIISFLEVVAGLKNLMLSG